jgi:hypothetical protein
LLPTLMANETRLARAIAPIVDQFAFIIDTAHHGLLSMRWWRPIEPDSGGNQLPGVSGLRELQNDRPVIALRPQLGFGYLPTLTEEQRSERESGGALKRYPAAAAASTNLPTWRTHIQVWTCLPTVHPRTAERPDLQLARTQNTPNWLSAF